MSTPPSKTPILDDSSSSTSSTRPSTPASSIASQDQETVADLDTLLKFSVEHPRWHASRLGTYNVILLPPVLASTMSNPGAGNAWVDQTFKALERTYDELGNRTPLDMCRDRPRHLTIVLNTEFGFNGLDSQAIGSMEGVRQAIYTARQPIPRDIEIEVQTAVRRRLRERYVNHRLIFAVSCCTEIAPEPGAVNQKPTGESRISVMMPWTDHIQLIPKLTDSGVDRWDKGRYNMLQATRESNKTDRLLPGEQQGKWARYERQRDESRVWIENFFGPTLNFEIAVGMSTCLDSKYEKYGGASLIAVASGSSGEANGILDESLGGYVINDAAYWVQMIDINGNPLPVTMKSQTYKNLADPNAPPDYQGDVEPGIREYVADPNGSFQVSMRAKHIYTPTSANGAPNLRIKFAPDSAEIGVSPARPLPGGRAVFSTTPNSAQIAPAPEDRNDGVDRSHRDYDIENQEQYRTGRQREQDTAERREKERARMSCFGRIFDSVSGRVRQDVPYMVPVLLSKESTFPKKERERLNDAALDDFLHGIEQKEINILKAIIMDQVSRRPEELSKAGVRTSITAMSRKDLIDIYLLANQKPIDNSGSSSSSSSTKPTAPPPGIASNSNNNNSDNIYLRTIALSNLAEAFLPWREVYRYETNPDATPTNDLPPSTTTTTTSSSSRT